jgi:hypothetical protein
MSQPKAADDCRPCLGEPSGPPAKSDHPLADFYRPPSPGAHDKGDIPQVASSGRYL